MRAKELNPQYVHGKKVKVRDAEWAKTIHKDLVASGKRSESESEEVDLDIVEEVKEVIKEVAEKTD